MPLELAIIEADHVKPLLVLTTGGIGDPVLVRWTEERIRHLLLDTVPRHQLQPRELLMEQIPALGEFFAFLAAHGHWNRENMGLVEAQALLRDLMLPVLEVVDDPSRPSEPEKLLAYAASLEIGLEDDAAFAQFLGWFNNDLTREERWQISHTGRFGASP